MAQRAKLLLHQLCHVQLQHILPDDLQIVKFSDSLLQDRL